MSDRTWAVLFFAAGIANVGLLLLAFHVREWGNVAVFTLNNVVGFCFAGYAWARNDR